MKTFEKYLMIVIFSLAFLGTVGIIPKIISLFLWISAGIYLFIGWKLLSPSEIYKLQIVPFLISYLIAQTIVTVLFSINAFPMKNELSYVTIGFLFFAIFFLLVYKKKLEIKYPIDRYLIRLIICFMFSFTPLWSDILQNN